MKMKARWLVLIFLFACEHPVTVEQPVTVVQVPVVDIRIAWLHRVADKVLLNELEIWEREGYACEKKYVESDTLIVDGHNWLALKELHVCWRITYEVIRQQYAQET
jgi:hypothetical protein